MQLAKRRASLEPIRSQRSQTSRNGTGSIPRAISSKPADKAIPKPSSALAALLPPLKHPTPLRKHPSPHQPSPSMGNHPKLTLDYHVLPNRRQHPRRSSSSRQSGLDSSKLLQRKESHLNTCYNQRKQRLVVLTKDNRRIYERINSQKSLYSSRELDRSFECSRSLSRRLSSSKVSKMTQGRSSDSLKKSRKGKEGEREKRRSIRIEPEDINTVEVDKMYRYLSIFCNHLNLKQPPPDKPKHPLPSKAIPTPNNKENNQTLHRPQLSKIHQQNNQRTIRRTNLQLARRH